MVLISNLWAFVPCAIQSTLKKKITEFCNNLPRCHNSTPKSTNSVTRVQYASLTTVLFAVLATKDPLLINTSKTFKIAERISGRVHKVERAHNPAWEVFHHLMNSLPEAKQIKNSAALSVKKGSFHSKWNGSIIFKVSLKPFLPFDPYKIYGNLVKCSRSGNIFEMGKIVKFHSGDHLQCK